MLLEKWYLDAVFPDGTVWYGYRARLRLWRWPAIPWASGCEVLPDGRERKISRWREFAEPLREGRRWCWTGPEGFETRWTPSCQGVESALGSDEQFRVHWKCLAPKAAVTRFGCDGAGDDRPQNRLACGTGYVEHLRVESSRADLPFRQLWWGRAHAGESSLVWIRWGNGRDMSVLFENGIPVKGTIETLSHGGVRVQTPHGCWETGTGRTLCDRDVRRSFPRWLVWLARGIAPARELKVAGTVHLSTDSGIVTGSALWEEVKWPGSIHSGLPK